MLGSENKGDSSVEGLAFRREVLEYGMSELGCTVDAPFSQYPEYQVLRHPLSGKWAAAILRVPASKVGGTGDVEIDIMNVKLDPLLVSTLKTQPGYAPAWHMSKTHWLSVRLDGKVPVNEACALLDMSFSLVGTRPGRKDGKVN